MKTDVADQIRKAFSKWLSLPNYDTVDIVAATLLANRLPGKAIWLAIVAPPATGKTEIAQALEGCLDVHMLDGITPATFASGYKASKKSARRFGLLEQMQDGKPHMVIVRDFSTVLQKRPEQRGEILGQLRDLYDGKFHQAFGNDVTVDWKGKLGMIVCSTTQYDREIRSLATFGDRFLVFRPSEGSRELVAERAGRNAGQTPQMEKELREAYGLLDTIKIPTVDPKVSLEARRMIAELADFVTRARSIVPRHTYTREVEDLPEIEGTARVSVQLNQLAKGLQLYMGRTEVTDHDLDLLESLTFSTIPFSRAKTLGSMELQSAISGNDLAKRIDAPQRVVARTIEDLKLLGIVDWKGGAQKSPYGGWEVQKKWKPFVFRLQKWITEQHSQSS